MTAPEKIFAQYETVARLWISFLPSYTEEQLLRKPSEDEWSLGQVYNHLIGSALYFHLKQIEVCAFGKGTTIKGGKTFKGKISYLLGTLPPIRIKVPPSEQYTPKQPSSKHELQEKLENAIRILGEAKAMVHASAPNIKTAHPAFGYLNALEWYQLIPMHYRHHLHQKKRLDTFISQYK